MNAEQSIIKMMEYVQKYNIEHEFDTYVDSDMNTEITKFTFFSFKTFLDFITKDFNCYDIRSSDTLKMWYMEGIGSPYLLYPKWLKHKDIFVDVNCISVSLNENIDFYIDISMNGILKLRPLQGSISIYYELLNSEECLVSIRIPMMSFIENPYEKINYHKELKQNILINCFKATNLLNIFPLCEPNLKKMILNYIL